MKPHKDDDPQLDNRALLQAASWLGVSNPEELLRTEGTGFAAPRPEGLGLGAKFLPHHKASHLTAPVEKRLGKRLRQQEDGAREEDIGTSPHKNRLSSQSHHSLPTAEALSSDEEPGRAAAFKTPSKFSQPAAAQRGIPVSHKKKLKKKAKDNDRTNPERMLSPKRAPSDSASRSRGISLTPAAYAVTEAPAAT
eukprot:jgi/Astpho2/7786/Aster-x1462